MLYMVVQVTTFSTATEARVCMTNGDRGREHGRTEMVGGRKPPDWMRIQLNNAN
jgi:hypothetical protein